MTTAKKATTPGVGDIDVKLEVAKRLQQSAGAEAAFRELQLDAPTGEGPIVRKAKALIGSEPARDAESSERKEHVARAAIHTNPVPEAAPEAKVVSNAKPDREPEPGQEAKRPAKRDAGDATVPGARKKEALAPMAVPAGGRALHGTLRLAVPPPVVPPAPGALPVAAGELARTSSIAGDDSFATVQQAHRRRLMVLVALTLFAVVCALVLWLVARVREQERESLLQESAEAARRLTSPTTASAIATATAPVAPPATAAPPSTVSTEQTGPSGRSSTPRPPTSARTSAASAASAPPASPSVKASGKPTTSATSTGSGGWIE